MDGINTKNLCDSFILFYDLVTEKVDGGHQETDPCMETKDFDPIRKDLEVVESVIDSMKTMIDDAAQNDRLPDKDEIKNILYSIDITMLENTVSGLGKLFKYATYDPYYEAELMAETNVGFYKIESSEYDRFSGAYDLAMQKYNKLYEDYCEIREDFLEGLKQIIKLLNYIQNNNI